MNHSPVIHQRYTSDTQGYIYMNNERHSIFTIKRHRFYLTHLKMVTF